MRLLHIDDDHAAYLMRWLRRLTLVAVLGGAAAGLALLFGLHPAAYATLIRVLGVVVAVMLGIMVLQLRGFRRVSRCARRRRAKRDPSGAIGSLQCGTTSRCSRSRRAGSAGRPVSRPAPAGIWMLLGTVAIVAGRPTRSPSL